ncbi:hypothetical protein [Methanobrevibacter sp.]|uniref:hypothetical protein n=1 Tax=Methanobrevibacter sp. TaxID=66852 RepID=UPI003864A022
MIVSLLLLVVVVLSASAAFAADDATLSNATDEAIGDEVLGVDEDVDALDVEDENVLNENDEPVLGATVTRETFSDYFDVDGNLISSVTEDELVFEGDFSNFGIRKISIDNFNRPIKLNGNGATFGEIEFWITRSDNIVIDGFNLTLTDHTASLIYVQGNNITISNSILNFKSFSPNCVIRAESTDGLNILNNVITYVGTDGTNTQNAIRVKDSTNIAVEGNTFNITIPSSPVEYDTLFNGKSFTDGIVITGENIIVKRNKITLRYNNVTGAGDTINVLVIGTNDVDQSDDFTNVAKNVTVEDNEINAVGHSFIYGISISAYDFNLRNNTVNVVSDSNYADGISIGADSNGKVEGNNITVYAPEAAYGIYAYEWKAMIENVIYQSNRISAVAYAACGMEIVNNAPAILENVITVLGNHTAGIAVNSIEQCPIRSNTIYNLGSNVGTKATNDGMIHMESIAIGIRGPADVIGNNITSTAVGISYVDFDNEHAFTVSNNKIEVAAKGDVENYAVYISNANETQVVDNNITFIGRTNGTTISNAIYIYNTKALIKQNDFDLTIPAVDIIYGPDYQELLVPAKGIVLDDCDGLEFENNTVNVTYGDIVGYYDTIRAIDINSNNASVKDNKIAAKGNSYIYALKLTGKDFEITNNDITATSNYYANGINIEGMSTGEINKNNITATAPNSAYPIYAGMSGQPLEMNVSDCNVIGEAYFVVGVEASGLKVKVENCNITVKGNHTMGIGAYVDDTVLVKSNNITSDASNEGNLFVWDELGTETAGIVVKKGNSTIADNVVHTTGEYAANLGDNNATITNNKMTSNVGVGDDAIIGLGNITTSGNTAVPTDKLKVVIAASGFTKVYGTDDLFKVIVLDEYGRQLFNKTIKVSVAGQTFTNVTDDLGYAYFNINVVPEEYVALIKFDGDDNYTYKSVYKAFAIEKAPTAFTAPDASILVSAAKSGYNYNIALKDNAGNALAGQTVTIVFNGKTTTATTNDKGEITYKAVAAKAGSYAMTLKFDGDSFYAAATATATIKVNKEATKLTAKKKTFKAKVKTKKYAVTLKDSKGKAIKKVKLTLKVKGKTYKATTNAKGKATFKIKNLKKKGKYTAKVNFAGNDLYNKVAKSVKITVKK